MFREMYKSKIQKATITHANLECEGSIGIDATLMQAADILPGEKVQVLNLDTGARFETYAIEEETGAGTICLYGPAAHRGKVGQKIFIISYCLIEDKQLSCLNSKAVLVDEHNQLKERVKKDD
ncbi:MAG: aspartate 1-decarboxylase [Candidatus Omnitrophica bacterium]|nr:aspartate 1-decarboxylase [Candidatus Omnitrophota bacterium]